MPLKPQSCLRVLRRSFCKMGSILSFPRTQTPWESLILNIWLLLGTLELLILVSCSHIKLELRRSQVVWLQFFLCVSTKENIIYILIDFYRFSCPEAARSLVKACLNKWGLSLNPWGNTVQVNWVEESDVSSKANKNCELLAKGMSKKGGRHLLFF